MRHAWVSAVLSLLSALLVALACSDDAPPGKPLSGWEEPTEAVAEADSGDELADAVLHRSDLRGVADLDGILERGSITVLVVPGRTNFFRSQQRLRGFEYELLSEYEKTLKKRAGRKSFKMFFLPVRFDDVLPALLDGRGDIAAAGLTVTAERERLVAFTQPYLTDVSEVVVHGPDVELESLDDLEGQTIYVTRGSSYVEHLSAAVPAADVREAPENLSTEDLLELVDGSVLPFTVADRHLAELWTAVFTDLVIRDDLATREGGEIAWAVRPSNPELLSDLSAFAREHRKGTLLGNLIFKRYFGSARWVHGPSEEEKARLAELEGLFRKYGERYRIHWLKLAALAFQESRFDHGARSRAGAVGIMQVLPATAASVGIENVESLEDNIHAAAKYLDWLRRSYFDQPEVAPEARVDFSLAAYNAGPNRVRRMRAKAAQLGYDPNVWFGNVEEIMLSEVGWEPVRYVANVNKYFFAFELIRQLEDRKRRTKERLLEGG